MSRSKVIPHEPPAEKKPAFWSAVRRVFVSGSGVLRAPWLLLIGYAAYLLWAWGVSYGLSYAFTALFEIWGVTAANIHLAPGWAQFIVRYYGSAVSIVSSAGVIAVSAWMIRCLLRRKVSLHFALRDFGRGVAAGLTVTGASAGLFLLIDSMRCGSSAAFSPDIIVFLPVYIAAACAEEAFCREFVLRTTVRDADVKRRRAIAACCLSALVMMFVSGSLSLGPVGAINMFMTGFICAGLHLAGHAWASVGFRFAWSYCSAVIFGFPGGNAVSAPLMSLYHVSDGWFTGGGSGLICGAWMTIVILAAAAVFCAGRRRNRPDYRE